jgi:hypothetical protein
MPLRCRINLHIALHVLCTASHNFGQIRWVKKVHGRILRYSISVLALLQERKGQEMAAFSA